MNNKLSEVIKLAKKTGDRIIVFDPEEGEESFVLMDLESYERLNNPIRKDFSDMKIKNDDIKNLTENELIDKINRDIAVWKNEDENRKIDSYKLIENFLQSEEDDFDEDEEEDNYYYYDEKDIPCVDFDSKSNDDDSDGGKRGSWDIPVDIKKGAEEVKE